MSKREECLENLKAQLDAWNGDVEKLEGTARVASAKLKEKFSREHHEPPA